jgi:hypothetical protein
MHVDHFGSRALGYLYPISSFSPTQPTRAKGGERARGPPPNKTTSKTTACLSISHVPRLLTSAAQAEGGTEGHTSWALRVPRESWRTSGVAPRMPRHLRSTSPLEESSGTSSPGRCKTATYAAPDPSITARFSGYEAMYLQHRTVLGVLFILCPPVVAKEDGGPDPSP